MKKLILLSMFSFCALTQAKISCQTPSESASKPLKVEACRIAHNLGYYNVPKLCEKHSEIIKVCTNLGSKYMDANVSFARNSGQVTGRGGVRFDDRVNCRINLNNKDKAVSADCSRID